MAAMRFSLDDKENKMKSMHIWLVMVLAVAILGASSCAKNGDDGNDGDDSDLPNFVQETCSGCAQEKRRSANGFRFYQLREEHRRQRQDRHDDQQQQGSASKEFTVTANTSYVFSGRRSPPRPRARPRSPTWRNSPARPGTPTRARRTDTIARERRPTCS